MRHDHHNGTGGEGENMRALVLEEFGGPFVLKEVTTPRISSHEALVRVRNVGVCGTDLKIRAGRMGLNVLPLIMGHEVAGEVAEVGSAVRGVAPGDRVTVNFYVTCGQCQFCREGRDTLCQHVRQHGFSLDGGFAEYVKTPGVNLCKVPDHVPLERACILADAVATSYHAVTKRAQVRPGKTVALVGVGGVGLHALQMAKLAGGWVIAVDVSEMRLELAQKFGADVVVDARQGPFDQAIRQLTDGQGVDVVIEFVANGETLPLSYRSLKRAGRLVFVGYTPELSMSIMPHELVRNEWEIVGARATTKQELQETMELVAQGRIQSIIDRIFPLEDIELAFEALRQGNSLGRNVVAV
jgi:2-desacetyl-2-hydroxyethyl bacteriochlorophyllide A dehydrogenase